MPSFPIQSKKALDFLNTITKLSISKMPGHVHQDDIEPNPTQAINDEKVCSLR